MADITEIKRQLNARIETLCERLLPKGTRRGNEWCVGSVRGEAGQSTRVHLSGEKAGVWGDFAGDDFGDALDLIQAVQGGTLADALKWAKDWLGIIEPQFYEPTPKKQYRKPERRPEVRTPVDGVVSYLTMERGLTPEMLATFKIGEIASRKFRLSGEQWHTCAAIVFPSLVGGELRFVKYLGVERPEGGKLTDVESQCEPVLFGWHTGTGNEREAVICEGEINAMSWRQLGVFALATPFGAGKGAKHNWIDSEWERLERFETLYLDFDQDAPGRESIAELPQRLGFHRCRIVPQKPQGLKDINDYLRAGCTPADARKLLDASQNCDPQELRSAADFAEEVIAEFNSDDPAIRGVEAGFAGLKGQFAYRLGEVTVFTGFSGHGKTMASNYEMLKLCANGQRCCIASFEMRGRKTLKRMVRQATGQKQPSDLYIRQVMEWMRGKLWIFDHVGSAKVDRILEVFEYALRRYNVRFFVIDSLSKCGIAEDDYNRQKEFMEKVTAFANLHQAHVVVIAHTRKQDDESDPPGKFDVRGGASLTDLIDNGVTLWRNKEKELANQFAAKHGYLPDKMQAKLEEPDALLIFWKIREAEDVEPRLDLYFDTESLQYAEASGDLRQALIPFKAPSGAAYDEREQWEEGEEIRF